MFDKTALWFYLGTFAALVAAGVGFPIPEELPIVLAGAAVGHADEGPLPPGFVENANAEAVQVVAGYAPGAPFPANLPWAALVSSAQMEMPRRSPLPNSLRWWIMLPVCILGVVISDGLLYGMGRFGGQRVLKNRFVSRLLPNERRQRIEENFHRYGVLVLLFARFLPTIRSPIFIMAGSLRLPFTRFLMADGLYALPGVSLLFFLAYWFGDQFRDLVERAEGKVDRLRPLLILLGIAVVVGFLIYHFLRSPVTEGDPKELLPLPERRPEHAAGSENLPSPALPDGQPPSPSPAESEQRG